MRLLAIDPGPDKSGVVVWDGSRVISSGHRDNESIRAMIAVGGYDRVACEMIASYGMAVGASVFETCLEIGRFKERSEANRTAFALVYRRDVKLHICGSARAKDANVRVALIDALGPIGTKNNPGPLHGVSGHAWAALAVAVTATNDARFLGVKCAHGGTTDAKSA